MHINALAYKRRNNWPTLKIRSAQHSQNFGVFYESDSHVKRTSRCIERRMKNITKENSHTPVFLCEKQKNSLLVDRNSWIGLVVTRLNNCTQTYLKNASHRVRVSRRPVQYAVQQVSLAVVARPRSSSTANSLLKMNASRWPAPKEWYRSVLHCVPDAGATAPRNPTTACLLCVRLHTDGRGNQSKIVLICTTAIERGDYNCR